MTLTLKYSARSDVGLLREGNEDSAYAGQHLLAVADGMGGHAHGEVASAVAIAALAPLDHDVPGSDLLGALERSVYEANETLHGMVEADRSLEGMGTTLTGMLWSGQRVAICHVGDSRAYLLRQGELHQITHDQTLVQSLVDEGRITEEEAATHPQRSLLLRALDGRGEVEPDLAMRDAHVGDRYLLCSDGLSGVVSTETLQRALHEGGEPEQVVHQLIELANRGGGPDNITCVVADVVDLGGGTMPPGAAPVVAGAAANSARRRSISPDTPAGRAQALTQPSGEDDDEGGDDDPPRRRPRRRWPGLLLAIVVVAAVLAGGGYGGWRYSQAQYFVGTERGEVVIYRGLHQKVAGYDLSKVHERTGISLDSLPTLERKQVRQTIGARSVTDAESIVARLRAAAAECRKMANETKTNAKGPARKQPTTAPTDQPTTAAPPSTPAAPAPADSANRCSRGGS